MAACKGTTKDKVSTLLAALIARPRSVNALMLASTFADTSRNQVVEWLESFEAAGLAKLDRSGREGIWHWTGAPLVPYLSEYERGLKAATSYLLGTAADYEQMLANTQKELARADLDKPALVNKVYEYTACSRLLRGQAANIGALSTPSTREVAE